MSDLIAEAKAIAASSSRIRAYAIDQATRFVALEAAVAAGQSRPAGAPGTAAAAGPFVDARPYGFEPWANGLNANTAWRNLLGDLAGTPESLTVQLPPGHFITDQFRDLTVAQLRFIGCGGNPAQLDSQPNPRAKTTCSWGGLPGAPMFGQDGGVEILKSGAVFEYVDFYNLLRDWSVDVFLANNVNDGAFEHCGAKYFRSLLHGTRSGGTGPDNAHWSLFYCFGYSNDHQVFGEGLYGLVVDGGEIIGESSRPQVAFWLGEGAHEVRVRNVKAVGCRGGFAQIWGGRNVLDGCDAEKCGDANHPVVDIQDGAGERGGDFNRVLESCTFTGSEVELPTRLGPGTTNCKAKAVHDNMGAHPGRRANAVLNLGTLNDVDDVYTRQVASVPDFTEWSLNGEPLATKAAGRPVSP